MDIAEAKARLDAVLDELAAAGFSVWGWDDESIQVGQANGQGAECAPRYAVDDSRRQMLAGFDVRRDIDGTPDEVREGRERP